MALPQVGYQESAKTPPTGENAMQTFVSRHHHQIRGTLSGFDRLRFVGTLRRLSFLNGLASFLSQTKRTSEANWSVTHGPSDGGKARGFEKTRGMRIDSS